MVCIPTCYTEKSIEVRALNVTMPGGKVLDIDDDVVEDKDEANNGTFSRLVWSEPVVQSPGN